MQTKTSNFSMRFYLGILGGLSLGVLFAFLVTLLVRQRRAALRGQSFMPPPERLILLEQRDTFAVSPAAAAQPPAPAPTMETASADDLKIIEGIGPKTARVLHEAGVRTFAALASAAPADLRAILDQAGLPKMINPATWPNQAALAARGEWNSLAHLQQTLKGGQR